jgi:hypothetical protein
MKRAAALAAVTRAFEERLARMCIMLGDGFESSGRDKANAKQHFADGLAMLADAEAFAVATVTAAFED